MYSENPLLLEMSTRQLLKKRKLYTPEQWRSMMDRLQRIGKNANAPISGLHSADEYGMRMYNGQLKRAFKTAKKHNRKLYMDDYTYPNNGSTTINWDGEDIISVSPYQTAKSAIRHYNPKLYSRKILRSRLKDTRNMSNNLSLGNVLAHEVDEYSIGLNRARKYGIKPGDAEISGLGLKNGQAATSSHNPGVLDREAKRYKMLSSLYGRDKFNLWKRDHEQFAKNKPKFVDKNIDIKREIFKNTNNKNLVKKLSPEIEKDIRTRADKIAKSMYEKFGIDVQSEITKPSDINKYKKIANKELNKLNRLIKKSKTVEEMDDFSNRIYGINDYINRMIQYTKYKFGKPSDVYR